MYLRFFRWLLRLFGRPWLVLRPFGAAFPFVAAVFAFLVRLVRLWSALAFVARLFWLLATAVVASHVRW